MVIAYVGQGAMSDDPGYARVRDAVFAAWPAAELPLPTVRYHEGPPDDDRLKPAIAAALRQRPQVLVLPTGAGAVAAKSLRHDTPVVFASYPDPVREGIVDALRRPGHRFTGVSLFDDVDLKRLELLKDAFPHVRTVGVLADGSWHATAGGAPLLAAARQRLGLTLLAFEAEAADSAQAQMHSVRAEAVDGWYIPPSYLAYVAEDRIIAALRQLKQPAIHATGAEVAAGALMAYSQDTGFAYDALAQLAVRVALGEDAGSIPVQRPYRYTLSVRIEPDAPWARITPSVVRRADRIYGP